MGEGKKALERMARVVRNEASVADTLGKPLTAERTILIALRELVGDSKRSESGWDVEGDVGNLVFEILELDL